MPPLRYFASACISARWVIYRLLLRTLFFFMLRIASLNNLAFFNWLLKVVSIFGYSDLFCFTFIYRNHELLFSQNRIVIRHCNSEVLWKGISCFKIYHVKVVFFVAKGPFFGKPRGGEAPSFCRKVPTFLLFLIFLSWLFFFLILKLEKSGSEGPLIPQGEGLLFEGWVWDPPQAYCRTLKII